MTQTHVVIIDGSAYIHRAFHARKPWHRERDGLNINAVVGFSEMLWKTQRRALAGMVATPATHLVVVFDSGTPNFRHKLYPAYKANRGPKDEELVPQFTLIRRATKAFGAYQIELVGYEADDIIATIAADMARQAHNVTIITSDKDLMQLIGPMIQIYDPMAKRPNDPENRKGLTMTADRVLHKFGVYPSELADYLAIVGDTADNVPGVEGMGPVTAAELIGTYGSIDGMFERIAEVKPAKRQMKLVECEAQLRLSRQLVGLDENVPAGFDLAKAEIRLPRKLDVLAFLKDMELHQMAKGVLNFIREREQRA